MANLYTKISLGVGNYVSINDNNHGHVIEIAKNGRIAIFSCQTERQNIDVSHMNNLLLIMHIEGI